MADNFLCLIGAIDRLWFHQTILFSEPISLHDPKSTETPQQSIITSSFTYPSSNLSLSPLTDEEISSADFSSLLHQQNPSDSPQMCATPQDDDSNNEEYDDDEKDQFKQQKKRPITRLNILANRLMLLRSTSSASSSSAPAAAARKLHKSMSCRSLGELELEEVKGFMDLGFTFKKENLSPRMMSLVPGLQRLGVGELQNSSTTAVDQVATKDGGDDDGDEVGVPRPYLSEAWLIKRSDSPLLNLRLPRVSAAADMKKHLRFWARTVASEVHQES